MNTNGLVDRLKSPLYTGLKAGALSIGILGFYGCGKTPIDPVDQSPEITNSYISPMFGMSPLEVTAQLSCIDDNGISRYAIVRGNDVTYSDTPINTTLTFSETGPLSLFCEDTAGQRATYGPVNINIDQSPEITNSNISPIAGMSPLEVTAQLSCIDDKRISRYAIVRGNDVTYSNTPIDATLTFLETGPLSLFCEDTAGQRATYGPIDINVTPLPENQIAFWSQRELPGGDHNEDIYKAYLDGDSLINVQRLTTNPRQDLQPDWSPDGSKIVFTSNRDGKNRLYIMDINGSNQTILTPNINSARSAGWSPDGTKIAFAYIDSGFRGIGSINPDGTGFNRLIEKPFDGTVSGGLTWSPDGSRIFYYAYENGNWDIFSVNIDGSDERNITDTPYNEFSYDVSPLGNKLSFISDQFGGLDVFSSNLDGTDRRRITNDPGVEVDPRFSQDGTKIIFAYDAPLLFNPQLYLVNSDGSGEWIQLTTQGSNRYPSWKPN